MIDDTMNFIKIIILIPEGNCTNEFLIFLQGEASYKSLQDMTDILMKGTKNFDEKTKGK